jgi:hypothetical protein
MWTHFIRKEHNGQSTTTEARSAERRTEGQKDRKREGQKERRRD